MLRLPRLIILFLLMSGCVDKVASDVELADMMQTDMEMLSGEVDASSEIQNQDTGLVNVADEGTTEDVSILDMMTMVDQAVDAFDVMVDASMVETCDPRRRSVACDAQSYCEENSNVEGVCVAGDQCSLVDGSGCDAQTPYCHLQGATSICTQAGTATRGQRCANDMSNVPIPCADGFVCDGSICREICDPAAQITCDDGGRCVNLSERTGQSAGYCAEPGCDFFTGSGCANGQVCRFNINTDPSIIGSCRQRPLAPVGINQPCDPTDDDCAQGLMCIRTRTGGSCKRLCDVGAYRAPCPERESCREAIALDEGNMIPVRSIGLCIRLQ